MPVWARTRRPAGWYSTEVRRHSLWGNSKYRAGSLLTPCWPHYYHSLPLEAGSCLHESTNFIPLKTFETCYCLVLNTSTATETYRLNLMVNHKLDMEKHICSSSTHRIGSSRPALATQSSNQNLLFWTLSKTQHSRSLGAVTLPYERTPCCWVAGCYSQVTVT